ncbi:MAG: cation:proton antiporter [Bryobacteraceae bacterium]
MNELASLGIILLVALLAGHLVKFVRLPEVVGYIAVGVVVGPYVMGWISHENLATLSVFSQVALGLILFSVGSIFDIQRVQTVGLRVLRVTLAESFLAAILVTTSMILLGQSWQASLLLGSIAMATAPASTLMVIRECNSSGPLTETLLGVIGVNNILCLTAFAAVAAVIDLSANMSSGGGEFLQTLYRSIYPLVWQLVGSVALGFLVGLLLASWATRVTEQGELLILITGCVLLCVGVALLLELSTLLASLAVGATMVNLSANSRRLFHALASSDPPFYAIFFVMAGSDLNLGLLKTMGVLGIVYVLARVAGKFIGAKFAAKREGLEPVVQRLLGFGLIAQAGLALGLVVTITRRYPELAPAVSTVVLAAVAISELVGPVAIRLAIVHSGEAREHPRKPVDVLA